MNRALVAFVAVLGACSDDAMTPPDGGDTIDARPDALGCDRPALQAPWLATFLNRWISMLAATPRSTTTQRMAAREYLTSELQGMGWTTQRGAFAGGENVYTTIPATMTPAEPEIIVGAHFDTVANSPGANDNASGTAVVLALAYYLTETPCRKAPVTLALFDLEETGLFGSRAFAMTRDPSAVRAVHTIDQVAWDSDGDGRFEIESPTDTLFTEWSAAAQIVGVSVTRTTTQGTDHEAFRDRGFAAVGLTEEYVGGDTSPYRHLPTDTADTVNETYLGLAAKLTTQVVLDELAP
ncbi:MAG TPA: M28 family peptidase [Kofleriaceae bacterium]